MIKKRNKIFIIAEIGPNHNGSFKRASLMIKKLSKIGVDAVKFQLGDPEQIFSNDSFLPDYQKTNLKNKSIKELSKKNQLTREQHYKLSKICKKNKLVYLCSAFDLESLKFLDKTLRIPIFKIPSGEAFSLDMLKFFSKKNKPILLSTGMTSFKDLKKILIKINSGKRKDITILHCISSYPADKKDLNLNLIETISKKFKYKVGYSDHSLGDQACLAAVAKGALVIEKHVTLSKKMKGPDHKTSLTIEEFKKMVKKIRDLEVMMGVNIKRFSRKEINVKNAARKSIVALNDIQKGTIIKLNDLTFKRPGLGISPLEVNKVIGKKAKYLIQKDTLVKKKKLSKYDF